MMKRLYTQEGFEKLNKIMGKYRIFFYLFLFLTLIIATVLIILSTYNTRLLFCIICSIVSTIGVLFAIFFFIVYRYYRKVVNDYLILKDGKPQETVIEFVDISLKPMTLSDKSTAYEIKAKNKKGTKTLYLSSLFSNDIFVPNKEYRIEVLYDYIVGYQDEH